MRYFATETCASQTPPDRKKDEITHDGHTSQQGNGADRWRLALWRLTETVSACYADGEVPRHYAVIADIAGRQDTGRTGVARPGTRPAKGENDDGSGRGLNCRHHITVSAGDGARILPV